MARTISILNALARESARNQRDYQRSLREAERERIRQIRESERAHRAAEKERQMDEKERKANYEQSRSEDAEDRTAQLATRVGELRDVLGHTLMVDDTISFESLRITEPFRAPTIPHAIAQPHRTPRKDEFVARVKPKSFMERALGLSKRYKNDKMAALQQFHLASAAYTSAEEERAAKLTEFQQQVRTAREAYDHWVEQRSAEVDEFEQSYRAAEPAAVTAYNTMVLERSEYPREFPQLFRLAYVPESKELVIEYQLPTIAVVPNVSEVNYVKSKDRLDEKARKPAEIKEIYEDVLASVALRTIHEVIEADQVGVIEVVTFSGVIETHDPATGRGVRPCVISIRATRETFSQINLKRIDKRACLRNLGARVSSQPGALQAVKPIVEFNMVDKRFIEQGDILQSLEERPNLLELSPSEFEVLVSNLFTKMGLETKLTRSSRDGGVDAIAYDTRPVLGGKVVIQAKRYSNTVGVSAVRDLYGTMLNEGASKGILVCTSGYGPDAYEFSKDKPMELIEGGGLLYLLEQVGVPARIVFASEIA